MNKERERIRKEIFDKHKEVTQEQANIHSEVIESEVNPELLKRFPPERLKKIMEKEARKYKHALKKKWDRWLEAVSK